MVTLKSGFYPRVIFLSIVHGIDHAFLMFFSPLLILMGNDLGLDYAALGGLVSFVFLTFGLGALPAGFISDRLGPKTTIIASMVIAGIGAILGSLAVSYWYLAFSFALMGAGASLYHPPAMALIASISSASTRGKAMGLHGMGSNLVMVTAPIIAGLLATYFHWRAAFLFWGCAGVLCGIIIWKLFDNPSIQTVAPPKERTSFFAGLPEILQDHKLVNILLLIFAITGIQGFLWSGTFAYMAPYLQDVHKLSVTISGFLAGIQYGIGAFGHLAGGYLTDRNSRILPVVMGTVGAALGFALIMLSLSPVLLLSGIVLLGFSLFIKQPAMTSLLADSSPESVHGRLYGFFFIITNTIGALAPIFGGLIISRFGFTAFFSLCIAITLCSFPFIYLLKKAIAPRFVAPAMKI